VFSFDLCLKFAGGKLMAAKLMFIALVFGGHQKWLNLRSVFKV
jgi:hypothetical protein